MERITIYQFTDPICVWSWGNDAVMRALEYLYAEKIRIEYVMGGLVEDISSLYDLKGSKLEIIRRSNEIFAENWRAASLRHGMPVVTDGMMLFSERYPSSFPQNTAYEAAKRLDPQKAKKFLRRIREATFIEGKRTSQIDILIKEATRVGYCAAKFIDEYTTGSAQADFMQDRMKCKRNGITGFPSYIIRNDETKVFLRGYQNFSTMQAIISKLSCEKIKARRVGASMANVLDFIRHYERVFPIEIEIAFNIDSEQATQIICNLEQNHKISREKIEGGYIITPLKGENDHKKETKHHENKESKRKHDKNLRENKSIKSDSYNL